MFALSCLFVLSSMLLFQGVLSAPMCELGLNARSSIEKRSIPSAPRWVIYSDKWVSGENGPPAASEIAGFNVFALSFLLISGAADQALEWTEISDSDRSALKSQYSAAGISLIVSAFGATDQPTTSGADAASTANTMAAWVKQYGLDGLDVDYEDFTAMDKSDGSAEAWLATFTKQIRTQLPQGQFILTHAPVAPWFSVNNLFAAGAYLKVDETVGDLIDWYNVQGTTEYTTCDSLLNTSGGDWPQSSVFEIAAAGVDLDKLVIGKPAQSAGDANSGYIAPDTLATCVSQAKAKGWDAGVMVWEFPDAASSWIATVRSAAFPV
ncbi:glycoside hydrolase [Lentinus tigrinus ALCF2SS1-6]|uniref:Glycoside hydrolase n=1 Tax=Lentinus tigrinus ALCF2SS1-6 TaxID=1328759 RepID=A0A5C2SLQ9_9APHY|nr:glycoside hydrolase [Lentinus tigrinus ALCF2SS1-6]